MSLIQIQGVTKGYYADRKKSVVQLALQDLNLRIEEGEFVSLLGPSGCGKTVTLNMLAGFERPTLGHVLFNGQEVRKPAPSRGVVFQEYSLLPWLSVRENLLFALKAAGVPKKDRAQRVQDALRTVGLLDCADRSPNLLSGGMRQRVAIARLFAMDSDLFLMDEPFSALDEQTRHALDAELFDLWRRKRKTIVFVTHNISEAVAVSSRIVLFSKSPGRVIGQWDLPPDMSRDLEDEQVRSLVLEIREKLPVSRT